jgi:nicotinamidase/pyrazinamidase
MSKKKSALLVIDLQNDFCSGGSMEVPNSLMVIPIVNRIKCKFDIVIFSKDWHPANHSSFVGNGGKLPPHCIQFSNGANLHSQLEIDKDRDFIVHKGTNPKYDAYSAFYDSKEINLKSILHQILEENSISNLFVCGLLAESSVYRTLLDAVKDRQSGYRCYLLKDATVGFDEDKIEKCYHHLQKLGVRFVTSESLN